VQTSAELHVLFHSISNATHFVQRKNCCHYNSAIKPSNSKVLLFH